MKVTKKPQVVIDLIDTAEYIARDSPEIADRFFDAFSRTIKILKQTPKIGSPRPIKGIPNLRMWFVQGFANSLIFYTITTKEITIIRVIHSARDYKKFFDK